MGLAFQAASKLGTTSVGSPSDMDQRSYHTSDLRRVLPHLRCPGADASSSTTSRSSGPTAVGSSSQPPAAEPRSWPAGLLVADDALLTWLRDYAVAGGHLVIGPRTAYGDEEGRARLEVKPAHLAEGGGVRLQEFSNLREPLPVVAETDAINLSEDGMAGR